MTTLTLTPTAVPAPRALWRLLLRSLGTEPGSGRPRFRLLPGGRAGDAPQHTTDAATGGPGGPDPAPDRPGSGSGSRFGRAAGQEPGQRPTVSDLYHSHRLSMVRLALLLVDDRASAEDVVQDAFVALYKRHGERLDDVDNALGYLRTAVVNTARSVLRRRKTAREYVPPHEADAPSAEDHALLGDEHRQVIQALHGLTSRQREVLVLRYWSDLSEAQIAETLGLSRGAVKSTASRALDALQRVLKAQDR
ncbi:RNA polymerase sigma factor [Streptomyces thermolilacinus]|uniref:RNA polymerase n=1 Tax=Streptomyces thermolilacinus SPC6 TaxID=1306406 RepID=A0A1D3DTK9_9ACTN|nr:SigE family RNA polymerase sigma factor [Streptomyces thermolilacinus]OEJ95660.1 RNA polymerase [Streptomyces thermolilacinus SPC6]